MDNPDSLAAATLATAQCRATGKLDVADCFAQFTAFEKLFKEHWESEATAEADTKKDASNETWSKLAE